MQNIFIRALSIVLTLVFATFTRCQPYAVVDAKQTVVGVSFSSTPPTTDTTCVAVGPAQTNKFIDHGVDQYGRCTLVVSGNSLITATKPRFAAGASRALALQGVKGQIESLLLRGTMLAAWQNDSQLVAIADRSAELTELTTRIAALKSAIAVGTQ